MTTRPLPRTPGRNHRLAFPRLLLLPALLLLPTLLAGQEKRPLDHQDYDRWNRIQQEALSPDGVWLHYRIVPGHGDATLHVQEVDGPSRHQVERGMGAAFTRDGRFLVFRIQPTQEARDAARREGGRNAEQPRDSLGILDLSSGVITRLDRVKGFTLPSDSREWVAVHREARPPAEGEREERAPAAREPRPEAPQEEPRTPRRDRPTGTDLHWRNLATGQERVLEGVTDYALSDDGTLLLYVVSTQEGNQDGVFFLRATDEAPRPLLEGVGQVAGLTADREWRRAAFLSNRDRWEEERPEHHLFLAELSGRGQARRVAEPGSPGIPEGWILNPEGSLAFSRDGSRLFFGTAPRPAPEPEPEEKDEMLENVKVDVWSWHDDFLQTHQLVELERERKRTYEAVLHLGRNRIVQLEDLSLLSVSVADRRNAAVALGRDDRPYRQIVSWDTRFVDLYLVDVNTGRRDLLVEKVRGSGSLSPAGAFVYWWDGGEWGSDAPRGWRVMEVATRNTVLATEAIPHPVFNELSDRPAPPGSYGLAGWTAGDRQMVVYDAHDLWLVDPRGREAPRNLTAGYGRDSGLRLRLVRLDDEDPFLHLDREVLLSAFHYGTKASGFYRARLDRGAAPERLVMDDVSYSTPRKAKDAGRLLFTKSTFRIFPDLWVSDAGLQGERRLTDANPQQAEVLWGTAELVSWTSVDGEELQGILYKPDDFDPRRQWPMMVYFYERSSNGLHSYAVPTAGTSINRSFYVSRGYLLFVPDIPYKEGYPGESAMNAVMPGILSLVERGFVDRERIGVQGHSWGGYQIAYMVTRTNLFAAAEAGAPVTNMTSAYGGIRWASGRVRQMQYETGQSRIGKNLWEAQHRYIENSPLFTAYKVETPLLILHNDEDGAVPWQEGIQFFVALRRLGKPAWLVNYNGQGHGVTGRFPQLDWTIRMQQFFDHYLKGEPPPVWMARGVPALDKGRTLGLDQVTGGGASGHRNEGER